MEMADGIISLFVCRYEGTKMNEHVGVVVFHPGAGIIIHAPRGGLIVLSRMPAANPKAQQDAKKPSPSAFSSEHVSWRFKDAAWPHVAPLVASLPAPPRLLIGPRANASIGFDSRLSILGS